MSKNEEAKLLAKVRKYIEASEHPVTFGQVVIHVSKQSPLGTVRPSDVKVATYKVIDSGEAKVTREWKIVPSREKAEKKGAAQISRRALSAA